MIEFSKFIAAFAEVYHLKRENTKEVVEAAIQHLSEVLRKTEDFRAVCTYIRDFMDHYEGMKEYHLEAEIYQCMNVGDSFFDACREWDI